MAENEFGLRELYSIKLKTTLPIEIAGKQFEKNETLIYLDSAQIMGINEFKDHIAARGGYENHPQVWWDTEKQTTISLTRGIFSQIHFALLSNSKIIVPSENQYIMVPMYERLESDESGIITFTKTPIDDSLFIYKLDSGDKLSYTKISDNKYQISEIYTDVVCDYYYDYDNSGNIMLLGKREIEGFLRLEGKTKVKDDVTGNVRTGIIVFPKVKLMSDLSMRLGENANPLVGQLDLLAMPVGSREQSRVMELYFLNDDIDE